ncbi:GDP-mannose 4,6-dehydratase [Promineifilum sp.]|uniref:GDP-mannose 4,6-dehydratase n=1 Tax=Promineifilum sp. TaxID=2664178 RepID=UPI0035B27616
MNVFITGGAGFIGCNLADYHLQRGHRVTIFDNLSRRGSDWNLEWLRQRHGARLDFRCGDIRDDNALNAALAPDTERIYHMAGQVAVTTSIVDPRQDFEINALGTFNVLEAMRQKAPDAALFYASTNKVYGGMESVATAEDGGRYAYQDYPYGIDEEYPLDFHSPYGCSKGAGDQYVRDYGRTYGLRTVVMRQSCIYGPRQLGVEDQGWVAHFCIATQYGRPLTIYGDGKQVRDVLWIDDLIAAYEAAAERIDVAAGQIYNLGGGPENTMSIWAEFGPILELLAGRPIPMTYAEWRVGDQRVFVSDIRKAERELGWRPRVGVQEGIERLWRWVGENPDLFA